MHSRQQCVLFSHDKVLPEEWGFGQQEVTCMQQSKLPKTIWYIEANQHPRCKFFFYYFSDTFKTENKKCGVKQR